MGSACELWPGMGTTHFLFDSTQSFDSTQLMTHNGLTRHHSNQLTTQNGFRKFDSNRLMMQTIENGTLCVKKMEKIGKRSLCQKNHKSSQNALGAKWLFTRSQNNLRALPLFLLDPPTYALFNDVRLFYDLMNSCWDKNTLYCSVRWNLQILMAHYSWPLWPWYLKFTAM